MKNFFIYMYKTMEHKFWVFVYLLEFSLRLIWRGVIHDNSKFSMKETKGFIKVTCKLYGLTYGSKEYKKTMKEIAPVINSHYDNNDHHPEHYKEGIKGMSLVSFVEMFCDWRAAVKRHKDGDIKKSIEICRKRFKINKDVLQILKNSIGGTKND